MSGNRARQGRKTHKARRAKARAAHASVYRSWIDCKKAKASAPVLAPKRLRNAPFSAEPMISEELIARICRLQERSTYYARLPQGSPQ